MSRVVQMHRDFGARIVANWCDLAWCIQANRSLRAVSARGNAQRIAITRNGRESTRLEIAGEIQKWQVMSEAVGDQSTSMTS